MPAERVKGGEAHTVFLSAPALEPVKGLRGLDNRYLFPSTMKIERPMSNMAMLAVLDRLGMRDRTTVHGLCRATFSTWACAKRQHVATRSRLPWRIARPTR